MDISFHFFPFYGQYLLLRKYVNKITERPPKTYTPCIFVNLFSFLIQISEEK